jgi:ribosomal protein S19
LVKEKEYLNMTFDVYFPEKVEGKTRVKNRSLRVFIPSSTVEKGRKTYRKFYIHNGRQYVKTTLTGASNMQIFGEFVTTKLLGKVIHNDERRRLKRLSLKKKRQAENSKRRLERKREKEENI